MKFTTSLLFALTLLLTTQTYSQQKSNIESQLEAMGLVDAASLSENIIVDMVYSTSDNFTGKVLYKDLKKAYLHPLAAEMLKKACAILSKSHPHMKVIVYDAARPMNVQQYMWDLVKGTSKNIYVSNPAKGGGLHNYGMAVDLTLATSDGTPLDMGTPFDFMGNASHIDKETELLQKEEITKEAIENRMILREAMKQAGFTPLRSEWWHFNAISRGEAIKNYIAIDIFE